MSCWKRSAAAVWERVHKARLQGQKELVALKIANAQVAGDAILSQRFKNEFKLAEPFASILIWCVP